MGLRAKALQAMSGEDATLRGGVMRCALSAATPFYALGNALRSAGFAAGLKRTHALGRPTVSVGNLTTGGTGKTPMVGYIARRLIERGHRPCILLRGYRGGDEAEEHRRLLGEQVRVEPNPDRVAAAQVALSEDPSITCFILDDGFQHRRASRDLDIVLIDATNPWGYGSMLPRGLMREPRSALTRADFVIKTRTDQAGPEAMRQLDETLSKLTVNTPTANAVHAWSGYRDAKDKTLALDALSDKKVMGVVGIGNPAAFTRSMTDHAGHVVHCEQLPDHHAYTRKLLLELLELAKTADAHAIVTTEKDWVKWSVLLEDDKPPLPIYRAELAIRFTKGEQRLIELLDQRVPMSG